MDKIIDELDKPDQPINQNKEEQLSKFRKELEKTINCYSMENGCNTPDFILAEYLIHCLNAFDQATNYREKWYGRTKENFD